MAVAVTHLYPRFEYPIPPPRFVTVACMALALVLIAGGLPAAIPSLEAQARVETGEMPKGVTLSPDGRRLYVTNYGQLDHRSVTVHDADTLARVDTIDLPGIVVESAVSPDGTTLYVSNFRRNTVQTVDVASHRVIREVSVGERPKILELSRDGRRLYAANWSGRSVTELDARTGQVVRTLSAGNHPRGMALTRRGRLYVANFSDRSIDVYDGPAMTQHRLLNSVCRVPRHLALSPDERMLYVSCLTDSLVAVLDTRTETVVHRVAVGRSPKALTVLSGGRYVATADYGGSGVSLIDTSTWTATSVDIPGMDHASGITAARTGLRLFVTGWYDGHLYSVGISGRGPHLTLPPLLRAQTLTLRAFHDQHPAE